MKLWNKFVRVRAIMKIISNFIVIDFIITIDKFDDLKAVRVFY